MAPRATGANESSTDRLLRVLRGVEQITFQNAENGFTVGRLAPERPAAEGEAQLAEVARGAHSADP